MQQVNLKEQVDVLVDHLDDMMLISEQMYNEKLYSNHRDYIIHRDMYEEKRELVKTALLNLILSIKPLST